MPRKDPEARREYYRAWKQSDAKRLSDKYYAAARHANQRAAKHGVGGKLTTADVRALLDKAPCTYCGSIDRLTVDHVVPMALGGQNEPGNLVAACHSCNARKRQGDRVSKWADHHEACIECGLTASPHAAKGLCRRCWHRAYYRSRNASSKLK